MHSLSISSRLGTSLSVFAKGQGQKIILLHGFPLDHRMWLPAAEILSINFHVIIPELRGFGQSTLPESQYSIADLADDVEQVRHHLASNEQVIVCGLSMGGYVALEYQARHGQHLQHLVLSNTKPNLDTLQARQGRLKMAQCATEQGSWAAASGMLENLVCATVQDNQPETVDLVKRMIREADGHSVAMAQRAMADRRDFEPLLSAIHIPTLVLAGDEDTICPCMATETWTQKLPNARFSCLAGVGHLAPLEAPIDFCSALSAALAS